MTTYRSFGAAIKHYHSLMRQEACLVHRGQWQGVDVSKRPEMGAYELVYMTMKVAMPTEELEHYRHAIEPNLPWADNHFDERVCGYPINPGIEWKNWPWGKNAEKFLVHDGMFDHNYMERYWPKYAGQSPASDTVEQYKEWPTFDQRGHYGVNEGYRFPYGDLNDVVAELVNDPTTRQAILPVFFPEDTGLRAGRRKPCSLFYHFMLQDNKLGIEYSLRSCDLFRHFRDDIYLTVRLLLWMLDRCRERHTFWADIEPGWFVMHIGNLHCFVNDMASLRG